MGSLNETVKAVSVDGNAATVEGIKDGSYTLARPFVVTTYGEVGEIAQDLLNYIMSAEGQAIINEGRLHRHRRRGPRPTPPLACPARSPWAAPPP